MDKDRFIYIQDRILKLTSRALANLIGSSEPAISSYRKGTRDIPEYIEKALETQAAISLGEMKFPISISDLIQLSRIAESKGLTVEDYIIRLIRADITPATQKTIRYTPEEIASSRLNEDSPETEPIRKRPA